ncbi:MAG: hypothetical protein IKZ30_00605, partial [Oscillospiraceae bacterium]|nr:hypothetical protein [Oscillospiraceae bacterium]
NKAKELHDRGVAIALSFSLTHFRIGYYPYWKEINECIRKMVVACHKYGIKLVEHHSSHLTLNLLTELGWDRLDGDLIAYGAGVCSRDNWKKIFPYLTVSRTVEGKFLPDLAQIDGATGELATNVYGAYSLCFNNPDYREVYFNYVKDVVKLGIDGIMNDDIQFFGDRKACTCKHCRKLFKEQTSYDIPDPEHWDEFFENYDNPAYIAWKKFKFASTTRMYRDLTKLYDDMGVKLLRPNYSSDVLMHKPTCYSFDHCMDLWTSVFQENCFSAIIKQSYINFFTEAIHRYAAGRRNNVPSMSMFYPDRQDTVYFGWALARSWGQLYNGTCEGVDITPIERRYRTFERENMRFYTAPDKIADVSFYFSQKTRDYTANAMVSYMHKFMGGMQAAYVSGLGVDMVFETDDVEELLRHKNIVLSHIAMFSDDEILRFAEYVRRGGRLIILGDFALFNEDGSKRNIDDVQAAFGVEFETDKAVKLGDGEIRRMSFAPEESEYQPTVWCFRRVENPVPEQVVLSKWEMQKAGTGAVLTSIVDPHLKIECENDHAVLTGYAVDGGLALHIMNLKEKLIEEISLLTKLDIQLVEKSVEVPPNPEMGDVAFPCFPLAKVMRKAPPVIAAEL